MKLQAQPKSLRDPFQIRCVKCIANIELLLVVIEKIGWSKAMQTYVDQEMIRLDVYLNSKSEYHGSMIRQQRIVKSILESLSEAQVLSWPLMLARVKLLLDELRVKLNLGQLETRAQQEFKRLCKRLITSSHQTESHLWLLLNTACEGRHDAGHGSSADTAKSALNGNAFDTLAQNLWGSAPKPALLASIHRYMLPQFGLISEQGWALLQNDPDIRYGMKSTHQISVQGNSIELQGIYQILMKLQHRNQLTSIAVAIQPGQWHLYFDSSQNTPKTLERLLGRSFKFLSQTIQIAPCKPQQRKSQVVSLQPQVTGFVNPVINEQCVLIGYYCCMSWRTVLTMMGRKSLKDTLYFEVDFESVDDLTNFYKHLKNSGEHYNAVLCISLQFLNVHSRTTIVDVLQNINRYVVDLGIVATSPQEMTTIQRWQGNLFSIIVVGKAWVRHLTVSNATFRGNCEANLKHLKSQGWRLFIRELDEYKALASCVRLGIDRIALSAELGADILQMEHL